MENLERPVEVQNIGVPVINVVIAKVVAIARAKLQTIALVVAHAMVPTRESFVSRAVQQRKLYE